MDQSYLAALPIMVAALAYAAVAPRARARPKAQRRALVRVARRVRLPIPEEARPRLERELRSYHLGADLGAAAAVVVTAGWGLTFGRDTVGGPTWLLILFAAALAGAAAGAGVAALREAARPPEGDGPRVARPVTPTLGDYLAPAELEGGRVVAVLPTILLAGLFVFGAEGTATTELIGPSVGAGLALVALVFGELAGRRILDAPQTAGSDLQLAWSDAIRAHTLRAVVTVPIAVGTYASLGVLAVVDLGRIAPSTPVAVGLVLLAAIVGGALLVAVIWSLTGEPHRYFRRRLWPDARNAARPAPSATPW